MKILKGCFSVFLLLLFIVVLFLSLSVNSVKSVVLSPGIILNFVDNLDFEDTALKISGEISNNIGGEGDGENLSSEEIDQIALDLVNSMTEEEKLTIKETAKTFISQGFEFVQDPDKQEIRVDVSEPKSIVFKLVLRTPDFRDHLNLPLPICETGQTENCLSEDGVANIMEKSLTGELTEEDITSVIPICTASMMINQQNCIPQDVIDDLLASNIDQNTNKEDEDAIGKVLEEDEIVITEEDIGGNLPTVRNYISKIDLYTGIALLVAGVIAILILLLQKARGLWYLGTGLIISSVLLFVPALIIKLQYEFLVGKLDDIGEVTENAFYDDILELFRQYTNAFAGSFMMRAGICLLFGAVFIAIAYFLSHRKKAGVKNEK